MSSIIQLPDGRHFVFMKGASEYIVEVSDKYMDFTSQQVQNISPELRKTMLDSIQHMASQALRTIGICYKEVKMEQIDQDKKNERGVYHFE